MSDMMPLGNIFLVSTKGIDMVFFNCNHVYKNSEAAYGPPSESALVDAGTKKFRKPSPSRRHP
jgi:hypothetical protein